MPKSIRQKTKAKITWVNFLHIYQPPWQEEGVIEQVANQSYDYLLALLKKYRNFKFTLSITGNLLDILASQRPDLIARLRHFVKNGQVELVGTAHYHAILPLLPKEEIKRQIDLNNEALQRYFGKTKINGFYLPEMAYSLGAAKVIKSLGFGWLILDPIAYIGRSAEKTLYEIRNLGLKVVFRDRRISKTYPPEIIWRKLTDLQQDQTIITATDGEIYGHFHTDWQGHLEKILLSGRLVVMTVGDYLATLEKTEKIELCPSSWESQQSEIKQGIPFIMWADPKNPIHGALWRLVNLAIILVHKYQQDKNWVWARQHLDRGLSSCTWWWASAKKLSAFSSVAWHPDMVDQGLEELIRSVRSLTKASRAEKIKAEKIYLEAKQLIWFKHWQKNIKY